MKDVWFQNSHSRSALAYKKQGRSTSRVLVLQNLSLRALRGHRGVVGEVKIVRGRAVEADPTLHDRPVRKEKPGAKAPLHSF